MVSILILQKTWSALCLKGTLSKTGVALNFNPHHQSEKPERSTEPGTNTNPCFFATLSASTCQPTLTSIFDLYLNEIRPINKPTSIVFVSIHLPDDRSSQQIHFYCRRTLTMALISELATRKKMNKMCLF